MGRTAGLVACLVIAGCASTGTADSADKARTEVLAATDAWRAAFDSRDPARITATYGNGSVFWGTTMKSIATSPQAIAEYFKDAASRPDTRVVFTEQHVRVYGDVAFNSGAYTFRDRRDGQEIITPARYSMVFHREGGNWVLVHHHSSRAP
jgi:hypothetical protein